MHVRDRMENYLLKIPENKSFVLTPNEDCIDLGKIRKRKVVKTSSLLEKTLIEKIKAGDENAFSQIFSAYYKDFVIFATKYTSDLNISEEIVQDTFVRLWEERQTINISISLRGYILKMVHNKCIDWLRHQKIRQKHNLFVQENSKQFDFQTDNYVLHSELKQQIEQVLKEMPPEISDVFRMNRFKGLKYHEIAGILNVSVRTIEVRIGKALKLLRIHLKDYFIFLLGFVGLIS